MKSKHTSQFGFSIVEVVITLAIIALILVVYQTAVNTIALTRESKNEEIALRIASTKLEELRNGGYSSVPASGSFTSSQFNLLPSGAGSMTTTDYNGIVKHITVTVQWNDVRTSTTRDITLATAVAKAGGL